MTPALGLPADKAAQALIAAIGEVTYTEDCKAAIDMARALCDSLTAEERTLVDDYDTLTAAEEAYAMLDLLEQQRRVDMALSWTEKAYNGNPQKPAVTVTDYLGETLTENTDYTLTWSNVNSKFPGDYTVTVTGIGQYSGEVTAGYTIKKQTLDVSRVTLSWATAVYNSTLVQRPAVTVTAGNNKWVLTEGKHYTVSYSSDSKYPGSYTVTVRGRGNFTGTVKKTYVITPQPLDETLVTLDWAETFYNGTVQKPKVTVKNAEGYPLTKDKSYTVRYENNSKFPGTYTVIVTCKGFYTGTAEKTYTITKQTIDASRVTLEWTTAVYNSKLQRPAVTVVNSKDRPLTEGTHYTVSYSNVNKATGKYTVTVRGRGNYTGTVKKTFTITKQPIDASRVTLSAESFTYDSAEHKPTVTVRNIDGNPITQNVSYTVAYSGDCTAPGPYTVTITGKGYYAGTVTKTFTIQ